MLIPAASNSTRATASPDHRSQCPAPAHRPPLRHRDHAPGKIIRQGRRRLPTAWSWTSQVNWRGTPGRRDGIVLPSGHSAMPPSSISWPASRPETALLDHVPTAEKSWPESLLTASTRSHRDTHGNHLQLECVRLYETPELLGRCGSPSGQTDSGAGHFAKAQADFAPASRWQATCRPFRVVILGAGCSESEKFNDRFPAMKSKMVRKGPSYPDPKREGRQP